MKKVLTVLAATLLLAASAFAQNIYNYPAQSGSNPQTQTYSANQYGGWQGQIVTGNSATGSQTVTVYTSGAFPGNRAAGVNPFLLAAPISFTGETVTPSAIPSCGVARPTGFTAPAGGFLCNITASFSNLHSAGETIRSGDGGLIEAEADAYASGGGIVTLDSKTLGMPLTYSTLSVAPIYQSVGFADFSQAMPVYWNPTPATATSFSAPAALAAGTVASSTTVAGSASYAAGTIHVCYALVDVMGNEGPCSADYSFTDTSTKAIVFQAPPAATGAVGYIPYIGLEAGSAANEYQMPLFTQPTVIGAPLVGNGVCTLTTIETTTPACAITNTTYGQTGAIATVTAYPVVTSPQAVGTGGLSTASFYIGNTNSRTVYSYQPGANPSIPGIVKASQAFNITTAAASTVPQVLGTLAIPPGFMNYVGRSIEVCGYAYSSTQGASTVVKIQFEWDAQGSDVTTGLPVIIGGPFVTNTLTTGTTGQFDFCQDFTTTVAAATATGGSIRAGHGYLIECALTTCATPAAGPNMTVAAVGSLNLAAPARLQVIMVQTTSSTAVPQLINLTVRVLN